jgi:aspartyl-tRNA(Asn)/glutamyl-tRNA(Gln) amidotransferase subunit A
MTILESAAALRAGKVSSVELTRDSLRRIERDNSKLNAFITVISAPALERAAEMDAELAQGTDRGPLHGVPIAHKDLVCTKGTRTTGGSKIFADFIPDFDAEVVTRLDEAGAVLVGKTGLHELAYGITSNNPHYGAIRNPWNPDTISGGSSGGSGVAVAADLVSMATGTDTGGSIRIPSSFCGTVGLKPTYERISRRGVLPLSLTFDHVGPMTRTVRDAAIAFHAMAHRNGQSADEYVPPAHVDIRGLRVGVPRNFFFDRLDPQVERAVRKAIDTAAALGAVIHEVHVPDMGAVNTVGRVLLLAEAVSVLRPHLDRRADFGTDVLALPDQGRLISAADYLDAQRLRRIACQEFSGLWRDVDCVLTPCTPTVAPRIGQTTVQVGAVEEDVRLATTRFMRSINILGIPALAMPAGFSDDGLPIGLQLLGPPQKEAIVLRVGAALEDVLGVSGRRPVVS